MKNEKNIYSLLSQIYEENSFYGIEEAFMKICRYYALDQFSFVYCNYPEDYIVIFELSSNSHSNNWTTHNTQNQHQLCNACLKESCKTRLPYTYDDSLIENNIMFPGYPKNGYQSFFSIENNIKIHPELLNVLKISCNIYAEKKSLFESKELIAKITSREYEILNLKSKGICIKEIASRLQISKNTVIFHIRNIKKKLNATSIEHTMFKFGFAITR